VIRFRFK